MKRCLEVPEAVKFIIIIFGISDETFANSWERSCYNFMVTAICLITHQKSPHRITFPVVLCGFTRPPRTQAITVQYFLRACLLAVPSLQSLHRFLPPTHTHHCLCPLLTTVLYCVKLKPNQRKQYNRTHYFRHFLPTVLASLFVSTPVPSLLPSPSRLLSLLSLCLSVFSLLLYTGSSSLIA